VSELIKLRNERLQKQQEEAEALEAKKVVIKPESKALIHPAKEITIDTLRGLYWMASADHLGPKEYFPDGKKATKPEVKRRLNDLLHTYEGVGAFLKSLQEFVFS
jgi:hypothetical protein